LKLVAVSQRVDWVDGRDEVRDSLDQRLTGFLVAVGVLPIPVPNELLSKVNEVLDCPLERWLKRIEPQAIILSGGNDIGSSMERDLTERYLINYARDLDLPLLGICRGMQMLAHWAGTGLRRVDKHVAVRHRIIGDINRDVNSFHNYAISDSPEGFRIIGQSDDGVIEAIMHERLRWEGWMWHPERESVFQSEDLDRASKLFNV
jgi:gamma-glutamyl-gamma-aminobutyrate hydrolase PuuD